MELKLLMAFGFATLTVEIHKKTRAVAYNE